MALNDTKSHGLHLGHFQFSFTPPPLIQEKVRMSDNTPLILPNTLLISLHIKEKAGRGSAPWRLGG